MFKSCLSNKEENKSLHKHMMKQEMIMQDKYINVIMSTVICKNCVLLWGCTFPILPVNVKMPPLRNITFIWNATLKWTGCWKSLKKQNAPIMPHNF